MREDMQFNGTRLIWSGQSFHATSGALGYQFAVFQCRKGTATREGGPIPEGWFSLQLVDSGAAKVIDKSCTLAWKPGLQSIPTTCDFSGWGSNRIPLEFLRFDEAAFLRKKRSWLNDWDKDRKELFHKSWTRKDIVQHFDKARCAGVGGRNGFYLHDSKKGHTQGCIEVEAKFFVALRKFMSDNKKLRSLALRVSYPSYKSATLGKTKQ